MQDADPTIDVALQRHRPRWRAYLLLSRVSNLPTVWSNVLAGLVAGAALPDSTTSPITVALLMLAASAFYTGGMFLNDAFDAPFDRRARPERPLPRGEVGLTEAFVAGGALLALGLALVSSNRGALMVGMGLAAAVVFYDARHKGSAVAPLVMGACRGLVYVMAAATGVLSSAAWAGAGVMLVYVAGLTVVAKRAGANARWLIPALIAGISIVDAVFILVVNPSSVSLAVIAALGCPLTLALQRWVPGD
jgi:4-hydroxybenzoate polyprenyltransferase